MTEILNGKRSITKKTIDKLGLALGLSLREINSFEAVAVSTIKTTQASKADYHQINIDQYALISDWYHYAILELIKVKDFKSDNSWIAKALDISKSEANIAIERLLRLGLIERAEDGTLSDTSSGFSTNINGNMTSAGSRQLQEQILQQSIQALRTVPVTARNHTSMTMAIDPVHLPEAIKRITKFRRELCEYLESQGAPQEIYQLSVSLFPITKIHQPQSLGEVT